MSAELLRLSAAGDADAFMRFYDATCSYAYQWALRRHRDRARAEDALRALYAQAWAHAAEHADSGISPVAWLLTRGQASSAGRGAVAGGFRG